VQGAEGWGGRPGCECHPHQATRCRSASCTKGCHATRGDPRLQGRWHAAPVGGGTQTLDREAPENVDVKSLNRGLRVRAHRHCIAPHPRAHFSGKELEGAVPVATTKTRTTTTSPVTWYGRTCWMWAVLAVPVLKCTPAASAGAHPCRPISPLAARVHSTVSMYLLHGTTHAPLLVIGYW
jgi:hypothetical protein